MDLTRGKFLEETRRSAFYFNLLAILVGFVVLGGAAYWGGESIDLYLEVGGGALVSAGLVNLVFGAITLRETTRQVDVAVNDAISDSLQPVRETVLEGAQHGYRWNCFLQPAAPDDPLQEYAYQYLHVAYELDELPEELRAVCIATYDDDVLSRFRRDNYMVRWMVDEERDPADPRVFQFGPVKVNGDPLADREVVELELEQGRAHELRYQVPSNLRYGERPYLEYSAMFRKFTGEDRRIRLVSQLFATTVDAEYRLWVSPEIPLRNISVGTSQVTALGPHDVSSCGETFSAEQNQAAHAVFKFPLQAGSSISFTLERDLS